MHFLDFLHFLAPLFSLSTQLCFLVLGPLWKTLPSFQLLPSPPPCPWPDCGRRKPSGWCCPISGRCCQSSRPPPQAEIDDLLDPVGSRVYQHILAHIVQVFLGFCSLKMCGMHIRWTEKTCPWWGAQKMPCSCWSHPRSSWPWTCRIYLISQSPMVGEGVKGHRLIWASGMLPPKLRHILGCLAF